MVEAFGIVREQEIDTFRSERGINSLFTLCWCSRPPNAADTQFIITPANERNVVTKNRRSGLGNDPLYFIAGIKFVVIPTSEEVAIRRIDRPKSFCDWFNAGPIEVNEVTGVADHVWSFIAKLISNGNRPVDAHQLANMDIADMPDSNAVECLGPIWGDDCFFPNHNILIVVPPIHPPTSNPIRAGGHQEMPNPSLAEFE